MNPSTAAQGGWMTSVEVVEGADRLAAIVPAWRDFWSRTPAATPFQSPDWLLPWWDIFAPGKLRVIAVWNAQALIGIAPLYIEDGCDRRRLLPLGISLSDYLNVGFDLQRFGEAAQALSNALNDMKDDEIPFGISPEEIIADAAKEYNYPVCFNFHAGHIERNLALYLGKEVKLNINSDNCSLEF